MKLQSTALQRKKYDIEGLTLEPLDTLVVEENLMDPVFRELESMDEVFLVHVEVKMKSSLDVLSHSNNASLLEKFLGDRSDAERAQIAECFKKYSDKRKGNEFNQFFMRDLISLKQAETSGTSKKKASKNIFDGRGFFLEGLETREAAIRAISAQENNYFRVFDHKGERLHFEDYDKLFSSIFSDWRTTLCSIVAQSFSQELLRAVTFMQNMAGNSLGDSLVRLTSLGYNEVKKEKGIAYLFDIAEHVVAAILDTLEHTNLNEPIDIHVDHFDEIKKKVVETLKERSIESQDIDLKVIYVCLLSLMAFCDTSAMIKLAIRKDKELKPNSQFHFSAKFAQGSKAENDGTFYFFSKSTLIDFGAKQDYNLANLLEAFRGLDTYAEYLQNSNSS